MFLYWYVALWLWVLLGLSILFAGFALKKKSRKIMIISVFCSIPNTVFVLFVELEKVMYLLLVWFIMQLVLLYFLNKRRRPFIKE
ncbi:hypothetical protein GCM10008983_03690 [Lentibacillus halophilus]|uniref:Uncharacterized protein n=1 Tax=Lentibacillus halophilus TaxID=295065 RepID=A0ABP3IWK7_9BACI